MEKQKIKSGIVLYLIKLESRESLFSSPKYYLTIYFGKANLWFRI